LETVDIRRPAAPLVANVLAAAVTDPEEIRRLLVKQVTGAVRWRESLLFMAAKGVGVFVECGAGKVLSGLAKRVCPEATGVSIEFPADILAYKSRA